MARLIFRAKNTFGPNPAKHHRGHQRGDCIDILRDDQFCGLEVVAKDLWRVVVVPGYPPERFAYLLESEPYHLGEGSHKKKWSVNLDKLETPFLSAEDEITILDPNVIDGLATVKRRSPNKLVVG